MYTNSNIFQLIGNIYSSRLKLTEDQELVYNFVFQDMYDPMTGTGPTSVSGIRGAAFSDDGMNLYTAYVNYGIQQYVLSAPYAVGVLTPVYRLDARANTSNPQGISISPDGQTIFLGSNSPLGVIEYKLNQPNVLSSAVYSYYFPTGVGTMRGCHVNESGTKLYVLWNSDDDTYCGIRQFEMSTPWELSSVYYDNKECTIGKSRAPIFDFCISPDGNNLLIPTEASESSFKTGTHIFNLKTPWDISTLGDKYKLYPETGVFAQFCGTDGTYITNTSLNNRNITRRNLLKPYGGQFMDLTVHTPRLDSDDAIKAITFSPSGEYVLLSTGDSPNQLLKIKLNVPWEIKNGYYSTESQSISTGYADYGVAGCYMSPDGLDLVYGNIYSLVHHELSAYWDLDSSISQEKWRSNSRQIHGVNFTNDGLRMHVSFGTHIEDYILSSAYNISSAAYAASGAYLSGNSIRDFYITADGRQLICSNIKESPIGNDNQYISTYVMWRPGDISTATLLPDEMVFRKLDRWYYRLGGIYLNEDTNKLYLSIHSQWNGKPYEISNNGILMIDITKSISSLSIVGPDLVTEGTSAQYTCYATYSDATTALVSPIWSENSTYTTIDTNGLLTAGNVLSDQNVTITAMFGGKIDTHAITIKYVAPTLNSIVIEGPATVLEESEQQYLCRANWSDGDYTYVSPVWSDNSSYATVSSYGLLRTGNVTKNENVVITAIYGGKADTHLVTIQYVPA